jgi:hypothetical protein
VADLRKDRAYIKYAWVFPFVLGLFSIVVGLLPLVNGWTAICSGCQVPTSSTIVGYLNMFAGEVGLAILFYGGILTAMVAWVGFRKWVKLAWYVLFVRLLFALADLALYGIANLPALVSVVLLALGLFPPYRKFFPLGSSTPA